MLSLVQELADLLVNRKYMAVTAESCTGGMIAAAITNMPGSSAVFDRGFVTYSNEAKMDMLGVSKTTLQNHGAVSEQTATEMVLGALDNSRAKIAVAVTGIAGPDGGNDEKPVGMVYIGVGLKNQTPQIHEHHFEGSRETIRQQTVKMALNHMIRLMDAAT